MKKAVTKSRIWSKRGQTQVHLKSLIMTWLLTAESSRLHSSRVRLTWVTYLRMLCLLRLLMNPKLFLSSLLTKLNLIKDASSTILSWSLNRLLLRQLKTRRAIIDSSYSSSSLTRYIKLWITCEMSLSKMAKQRTISLILAKIWIIRLLLNEFLNIRRLMKY